MTHQFYEARFTPSDGWRMIV